LQIEDLAKKLVKTMEDLATLRKDFEGTLRERPSSARQDDGRKPLERSSSKAMDPKKKPPPNESQSKGRSQTREPTKTEVEREGKAAHEASKKETDVLKKEIETITAHLKDLYKRVENKAEVSVIEELLKARGALEENQMRLQSQLDFQRGLLDSKADKADNLSITQEMHQLNLSMENIRDEKVLKGLFEELTQNVNLLFEVKADAAAVRQALSEKGDAKILATKASRAYCDALVERLSKSLNELTNKVELFGNHGFADINAKIKHLFKALKHKVDKDELNQLLMTSHNEIDPNSTEVSQSIGADGGAAVKKPALVLNCLSCNRPVRVTAPKPSLPNFPPAHPSNLNRGSYDAEFYRNQRRRFSHSIGLSLFLVVCFVSDSIFSSLSPTAQERAKMAERMKKTLAALNEEQEDEVVRLPIISSPTPDRDQDNPLRESDVKERRESRS
jgi:hypothetical protein